MVNRTIDIPTIDYYDANAAEFVADTVGANMSDALACFVSLLPASGRVLDWGCGSGRDSKALIQAGFCVTATDASAAMCEAAKTLAGIEPRNEGFLDLLEQSAYDGIWACASLLHLHRADLPAAMNCAFCALKPGGVLYASFKLGNFEGYRNGRWFTDLTEANLPEILPADQWQIAEVWQSGDVREGRGDERWLNILARKA